MSLANHATRRGLVRLVLRFIGASVVAILLAVARGLGGSRYQPPHTQQNLPTEVERKR